MHAFAHSHRREKVLLPSSDLRASTVGAWRGLEEPGMTDGHHCSQNLTQGVWLHGP